MQQNVQKLIYYALMDWQQNAPTFDRMRLNAYIDKHENILACFGLFLRGTRVTGRITEFHETFEGVMGIVSMNIQVLRIKMNQL